MNDARRNGWWRASALAVAAVALVAGCGGGGGGGGGDGGEAEAPEQLTIAYQPGIGYAQLLIIKRQRTLEKALPNTKVEWQQLSSGAAIRDGMISGDIQVGSGGVGPFIIGYDRGVEWKVLSTLNKMDLWLMTDDPDVRSLDDLEGGGKIAMPGPDSIQAIVLKKAAQEELGNAKALDRNIVALAHPDGLQALLSGQIQGHLTSPPFQFQEEDEGARKILGSFDLFGEHTFNSVFVREEFYGENREVMQTLFGQIEEATRMLNEQPAEAAQILAKESGGKPSAEAYEDYITREGVEYTTEPEGFLEFAKFMKEIGLIEEVPGSATEFTFDTVKAKS